MRVSWTQHWNKRKLTSPKQTIKKNDTITLTFCKICGSSCHFYVFKKRNPETKELIDEKCFACICDGCGNSPKNCLCDHV